MRASIIIPTLNEAERIGSLLERLNGEDVTVVDGKSSDDTEKICKEQGVQVIKSPVRGVGAQRNLGAKHAKGDLLIFLDADVEVPKDFLKRALDEFYRRRLEVACPYFISSGTGLIGRIGMSWTSAIFWLTQRVQANGAGPCIIVKKEVFAKTGGFPADMSFEDMIFIRNASEHGRYGVLSLRLPVSDRRFRKEGVSLLGKYVLLGVCFSLGRFDWAQRIEYRFEGYKKKNES